MNSSAFPDPSSFRLTGAVPYPHQKARANPLLSHLWLHEPDAGAIDRAARELGLPRAEPAELAQAYADLFLLNVPPYGSVFTDDAGELNGPGAQRAARLFEAHGYAPPELSEVGAPDHLGVWLGFMAHLGEERLEIGDWGGLMEMAPVCCLAVEREPSAHPFYRALAARTRQWLLADGRLAWPAPRSEAQSSAIDHRPPAELRLRDLVSFFLTPARSGVFLSRARLGAMALGLGTRLPFGTRFEVAEGLFEAAGRSGAVDRLIQEIESEVTAWAAAYSEWERAHPAWAPCAAHWLERTRSAGEALATMHDVLNEPADVEYGVADE